MAESATVVVLGGGVGGVVAARRLRSRLPSERRVVLVERRMEQSFPPSYTWVMTGERTAPAITRDLRRLRRKGIDVVEATVSAIDLAGRRVAAGDRELRYDYLVVALGADLAMDAVPGLAGEALTYYRADGAVELHRALERFSGGKIALVVSSLPYKCPAAPYEGAMSLDGLFRRRGIRNRVELSLSSPEPQPLPVAGPALGAAVVGMLQAKAIAYHPGRRLQSVDASARELVFEGGERERYDLLIAVPPHRAPAVVAGSRLAGTSGWISVDPGTMETEDPRVFALGDVTAIPLPDGLMLPKAGVFAHRQAEVVADRIAGLVRGARPERRFTGEGTCLLETGDGRAGVASGNFYAHPRAVQMRGPARWYRFQKLLFEKWWLYRWY